MDLSIGDGEAAVALARASVEAHLSGSHPRRGAWESGPFSETRGVFVTINRASSREDRLRGCIGFPHPVMRLGDAIVEAAVAASTEDLRFPPLTTSELDSVVFEVSALTLPTPLRPSRRADLPGQVRIGVDGLIVSGSGTSGLLLPQVATEFGMSQTEFLSQACLKAGLPPGSWLEEGTTVQVFQAEIFAEESPHGKVVRVELEAA